MIDHEKQNTQGLAYSGNDDFRCWMYSANRWRTRSACMDRYPVEQRYSGVGPVVVQSHVSSENGTTSVALLVNGAQVREDGAANPEEPLASFTQAWEPVSPGNYTLEVLATDPRGHIGRSNRVMVHISDEVFTAPLPLCRLDQLVAPESLEPADGASVASPVHFAWSYPKSECHPHSFAISISEPEGSADISGLGWGFITYDEHTMSREWKLQAGACYYWRALAYTPDAYGPPSAVRRFCIPPVASIPTSPPLLPAATINPSAIPNLIPTFIFIKNANCRQGPDTAYEVVTSFYANDQVTIEGRNNDSSWYWA